MRRLNSRNAWMVENLARTLLIGWERKIRVCGAWILASVRALDLAQQVVDRCIFFFCRLHLFELFLCGDGPFLLLDVPVNTIDLAVLVTLALDSLPSQVDQLFFLRGHVWNAVVSRVQRVIQVAHYGEDLDKDREANVHTKLNLDLLFVDLLELTRYPNAHEDLVGL
jgi:hypothetical protein